MHDFLFLMFIPNEYVSLITSGCITNDNDSPLSLISLGCLNEIQEGVPNDEDHKPTNNKRIMISLKIIFFLGYSLPHSI